MDCEPVTHTNTTTTLKIDLESDFPNLERCRMPYLLFSSTPETPVSAPQRNRLAFPKASSISSIRDMLISAFFANLQAVLVKTLSAQVTEVLFLKAITLLLVYNGYLLYSGKISLLKNSFSPQMISIGTLGAGSICLFYYSLDSLTLVEAISIYSIILVLNLALGCKIYKEHAPENLGRVLFCCLFGILLISQLGFSPNSSESETQSHTLSHFAAVILCLVSTICASGSQLMANNTSEEQESHVMVIYVNAIIFLTIGGFFVFYGDLTSLSFVSVLKIIGIAGSNIIGIHFAYKALKSSPSNIVSAFSYSQVFYSLFWDMLLFQQFPNLWSLIGSTLLIGSCLFLLLK